MFVFECRQIIRVSLTQITLYRYPSDYFANANTKGEAPLEST